MAIQTCLVTYIYLATYICPTKFSDVGFCPTKFKLCPTKIKSDRTNVLSSQIFICSPAQRKPLVPLVEPNWKLCSHMRVRNHCNQTTVYYRNRTPEHRCQYMVTRSAFDFRFHAHRIPCGQMELDESGYLGVRTWSETESKLFLHNNFFQYLHCCNPEYILCTVSSEDDKLLDWSTV